MKLLFCFLFASLLILLTACGSLRGDRPSERSELDNPELRLDDPADIGKVYLYGALDQSGTRYDKELIDRVIKAGIITNAPEIPPLPRPKGCDSGLCDLIFPRRTERLTLPVRPTQAPYSFVFLDANRNEIGKAIRIDGQVGETTAYSVEFSDDAPSGRTEITAMNKEGKPLISTFVDLVDN